MVASNTKYGLPVRLIRRLVLGAAFFHYVKPLTVLPETHHFQTFGVRVTRLLSDLAVYVSSVEIALGVLTHLYCQRVRLAQGSDQGKRY